MKNILVVLSIITVLSGLFVSLFSTPAYATATDELWDRLGNTQQTVQGDAALEDDKTIPQIVADIIQIVLGFLGLIFVILTLWSGFEWMTAGGNTETITKARKRLINAIIGLVIVLGVFVISEFVLEQVISSVQ